MPRSEQAPRVGWWSVGGGDGESCSGVRLRRLRIERPEGGGGVYKEAVLGVIDAGVDTGSVLSHSERVLRSDPYRATHEARNLVYGHLCAFIHEVSC